VGARLALRCAHQFASVSRALLLVRRLRRELVPPLLPLRLAELQPKDASPRAAHAHAHAHKHKHTHTHTNTRTSAPRTDCSARLRASAAHQRVGSSCHSVSMWSACAASCGARTAGGHTQTDEHDLSKVHATGNTCAGCARNAAAHHFWRCRRFTASILAVAAALRAVVRGAGCARVRGGACVVVSASLQQHDAHRLRRERRRAGDGQQRGACRHAGRHRRRARDDRRVAR
jgi:hypothetical protein